MDVPTETRTGGDVVIKVDKRAFYGLVAILGIISIFAVGLFLGRILSGSSQVVVQPQPVAAAPQQLQGLPQQGQQLPPIGQAVDPAQFQPAGDDVPIGDNPRLAIPELAKTDYVIDLGDIRFSDPPVDEVITLENKGSQELVIDKVTASCGCTAALLSENKLPPGGTGTLRLSHDPQTMKEHGQGVGPLSHALQITSNDPAAPTVRLLIKGNVVE